MMMTSLLGSFKLDWGSSLRWIFGAQKVLSGSMPPLMDCMGIGFASESVFALCLPLVVFCGPALLIALWLTPHMHLWGAYLGGPLLTTGVTLWGVPPWQVYPNAVMSLTFLLWPSWTGHLLRMVDCSVVVEGVSYVASDLTMRCDSAEHQRLAGVAMFYLCLVVPAFPLGIYLLLQRNLERLDSDAFRQGFAFLYAGYTQRTYEGACYTVSVGGRTFSHQLRTRLFVWWECVVMCRKFLLVAVTVAFGRTPNYQIYAGIWVLLFAVGLHVTCNPYEDRMMGRLESLSLSAVLSKLLLGNAIALGGLSAAAEDAVRTLAALLNISMLS